MYQHLYRCRNSCVYSVSMLFLVALFVNSSYASNSNNATGTSQYRAAGSYVIYMGVLPAEMIFDNIKMHGGLPAGAFRYHITVVVFDRDTGNRIFNASVSARMSNSSIDTGFKKLEDMSFNKKHVYGNYFKLSAPGPYRIQVIVKNRKKTEKILVEFQYLQAHVHLEN